MTLNTRKVALSGAGGNIGAVLRRLLPQQGVDLRSAELRPLTPLHPQEDLAHGDLREPAVVDGLLRGVDVLIHLAGTSIERPLPEIIDNNLRALHQVFEGARRHGVRRVVFASSNHAFGMHAPSARLRLDAPVRADGFYGLSKIWGEAMARMYWDKHGIEGIALRIGTAIDKPENPRQLSTWLGTDDLLQLVMRCIETPKVGYAAVWGISNNTRAYYDLSEGNAIGYRPTQNAEDWASEVMSRPDPLTDTERLFQGGSFVTIDYTPPHHRPAAASGGAPRADPAPA